MGCVTRVCRAERLTDGRNGVPLNGIDIALIRCGSNQQLPAFFPLAENDWTAIENISRLLKLIYSCYCGAEVTISSQSQKGWRRGKQKVFGGLTGDWWRVGSLPHPSAESHIEWPASKGSSSEYRGGQHALIDRALTRDDSDRRYQGKKRNGGPGNSDRTAISGKPLQPMVTRDQELQSVDPAFPVGPYTPMPRIRLQCARCVQPTLANQFAGDNRDLSIPSRSPESPLTVRYRGQQRIYSSSEQQGAVAGTSVAVASD